MATYRLFPSTNGPATAQTYSGNFISAVGFTASTGGTWFQGYWWWVASNQSTSPVKCALWSAISANSGVLVPGSVVTSGTLTASAWNYIPLATPIQLAPGHDPSNSLAGSIYVAAIGCNGNFPDTNNFWGTGGAGINGITNGPLFAYSGTAGNGGTKPAPYGIPQGIFSTGESDPSSGMPGNASNVDNFWVDVQISDTAPSGYAGSYRIWPNKADVNSATVADSAVAYNVAMEVDLSVSATVNYVHYYVPPNTPVSAGLATKADVWSISSGLKVASITSPAWTTESGGATPTLGANAGFWAKAAFAGGITLPPGNYRVSVYNANGANGGWGAKDASTNYFQSGVGGSGIVSGPLTAPNQASAQLATYYPGSGTGSTGGQPVFAYDGSDDFPSFTTGTNPAQQYWIDLEVTPQASTVAGSTATVAVAAPYGAASITLPWPVAASVAVAAFLGTLGIKVSEGPANVTVAARMGQVLINATQITVVIKSGFLGRKSVTASSATIGFKAGQPLQFGLSTLASDRWFPMYPG